MISQPLKGAVLIVNANPLLNLVHVGAFVPGAINRTSSMAVHAEGKGVNVARVLARLGHRVTLTGFAGGPSGAWLRDLVRKEGIEEAFLPTEATMRVGFMASSTRDGHPTTLLPNGFSVTPEECEALIKQVSRQLAGTALVIISGSVPDSAVNGLYRTLLEECQRAGVPCWLDAHGPALTWALTGSSPPRLAKPNRQEYLQSSDWDCVPELHITDGEQPVEVRSRLEGHWRVDPPVIRQVNPIGSGDCYLAGLAHGWLLDLPMPERLRLASAAGAANALRPDVAMIGWKDIESLLSQVEIDHKRANPLSDPD